MVVLILLEILQLQIRYGASGVPDAVSGGEGDSDVWVPPLTGRMHHLERISMLAGFFVQAAFYFCCNEIIETILANKMEKYQHKISTLETFKTAMSMGKKRSAHEIAIT